MGIITDRDLCCSIIAEGLRPRDHFNRGAYESEALSVVGRSRVWMPARN